MILLGGKSARQPWSERSLRLPRWATGGGRWLCVPPPMSGLNLDERLLACADAEALFEDGELFCDAGVLQF